MVFCFQSTTCDYCAGSFAIADLRCPLYTVLEGGFETRPPLKREKTRCYLNSVIVGLVACFLLY